MMNTAVEADFERSITPVTVLRNMASTAPAFGMVGTLVGMVIMLQNIQGDMTKMMALQAGGQDPVATEVAERIQAITE